MIKKSVIKEISDSEYTTVYEVPRGKKSELVMLWITNPDSNNASLELGFYNSSEDTTITILDDYTVNQKDFIQIGGLENTFVILEEFDSLVAKGSSNSTFKIVAAMKEYNSIIQGG